MQQGLCSPLGQRLGWRSEEWGWCEAPSLLLGLPHAETAPAGAGRNPDYATRAVQAEKPHLEMKR